MRMVLDLTSAQVKVLRSGVGSIVVEASQFEQASRGSASRKKALRSRVLQRQHVRSHRPQTPVRASPVVRQVISGWNRHPFILGLIRERGPEVRHYQVGKRDLKETISLVKKVLKGVRPDRLLDSMGQYLAACERGEHVWDGVNHGFRSLSGFLQRLSRDQRQGRNAWWEKRQNEVVRKPIEDAHPATTRFLIRLYANAFLKGNDYNPPNPSREYQYFVTASQRMSRFMKERGLRSKKAVATVMIKCLQQLGQDRIVYPGNFAMDTLWNVMIPQMMGDE